MTEKETARKNAQKSPIVPSFEKVNPTSPARHGGSKNDDKGSSTKRQSGGGDQGNKGGSQESGQNSRQSGGMGSSQEIPEENSI